MKNCKNPKWWQNASFAGLCSYAPLKFIRMKWRLRLAEKSQLTVDGNFFLTDDNFMSIAGKCSVGKRNDLPSACDSFTPSSSSVIWPKLLSMAAKLISSYRKTRLLNKWSELQWGLFEFCIHTGIKWKIAYYRLRLFFNKLESKTKFKNQLFILIKILK